MDLPWAGALSGGGPSDDAPPPWVKYSRLQTQQELCARRFLRFASLHHVHGAVALVTAALWFSGVSLPLAAAPLAYFTGLVALGRKHLPSCSLEHLSLFILVLNALNALHLAALCAVQGERLLASPLFAVLPLSRVLFGLFTQEVHCHLVMSTGLSALAVCCSSKRVVGGEALLVVIAALLLELTAVVVLAEGPCGYEEAIMHLAQCRAQHQLTQSHAMQRIDVEREEFSGQLLAIATQGIAELTGSVQRASEPVLNMLKSSCATGTKSAAEAERIGRIGEALKEEVAEILRYKTQVAWSRLQERAKERAIRLKEYAAAQQAASEAMLRAIHQSMGGSLAQMHELELEAESSLEQMIHSEINRAAEIADARMDLVRQSAQAMERRVSDTVEVLLSLLKYFRSKGGPGGPVVAAPRPIRAGPPAAQPRAPGAHHEVRPARLVPPRAGGGGGQDGACGGGAAAAAAGSPLSGGGGGGSSGALLPPIQEPGEGGPEGDVENHLPDALEEDRQGAVRRPAFGPGSGLPFTILVRGGSSGSLEAMASSSAMSSSEGATTEGPDPSGSTSCGQFVEAASSTASDVGGGGRLGNQRLESLHEAASSSQSAACGLGEHEQAAADDLGSESGQSLNGPGWTPWAHDGAAASSAAAAAAPRVSLGGGLSISREALARHPLFASRLSYQTDNFFWCWASSRDFRAETDALRQWQRAAAQCSAAGSSGVDHHGNTQAGAEAVSTSGASGGGGGAPTLAAVPGRSPDGAGLLPEQVFVDLSEVDVQTAGSSIAAEEDLPSRAGDQSADDAD